MKGEVIAISNQKGGVGKTTVTTLLANILHFQGGLSLGNKIAILDLDNPQFSTYNRRQTMERIFKSKSRQWKMVLEVRKKYDDLIVFPATLCEAPSIIEKLQPAYDFIFLDMPGTLNTNSHPNEDVSNKVQQDESLAEEVFESKQNPLGFAYAYVNHFFIPVYQDGDTIRSSIDFYNQIMEIIAPLSPNFKSCQFFFNRVPSNNELGKYKKRLTEQDYPVMKNIIHQYRIYENRFRNTMIPIPLNHKGTEKAAKGLLFFANEFLSVIEKANHKSNTSFIIEPQIDPSIDLAINIASDIEQQEIAQDELQAMKKTTDQLSSQNISIEDIKNIKANSSNNNPSPPID